MNKYTASALFSFLFAGLLFQGCERVEFTNIMDPRSPEYVMHDSLAADADRDGISNYWDDDDDDDTINYHDPDSKWYKYGESSDDFIPPVLRLIGPDTSVVHIGETWTDEGATATDDEDGNITGKIEVTGVEDVVTDTLAVFTIVYTVQDRAGNKSTVRRYVKVTDITPPRLTLKGDSLITLFAGDDYNEPGFTATDLLDGTLTGRVKISGSVNAAIPDTYDLEYTVEDKSGNSASDKRTIIVRDPTPVLTIESDSVIYVHINESFTEPDAEARDPKYGDISSDITVSGTVNTAAAGDYTVTWSVTNEDGLFVTAYRIVRVYVKAIRAEHPYFLLEDSTLWISGRHFDQDGNQMGDSIFAKVADDVVDFCVASRLMLVKADGSLWARGYNLNGQFGNGTRTGSNELISIADDVKKVKCSQNITLIIKNDNTLWGAGAGVYGYQSIVTDPFEEITTSVADMAVGENHSLVIKLDGSLWGYGRNANGQLGDGLHDYSSISALKMIMESGVSKAGCFNFSSFIIKNDGTVWASGSQSCLGISSTTPTFTQLSLPPVKDISSNCLILLNDGNLVKDIYGTRTTVADSVVSVSYQSYGQTIVKTDGSVWQLTLPGYNGDQVRLNRIYY